MINSQGTWFSEHERAQNAAWNVAKAKEGVYRKIDLIRAGVINFGVLQVIRPIMILFFFEVQHTLRHFECKIGGETGPRKPKSLDYNDAYECVIS